MTDPHAEERHTLKLLVLVTLMLLALFLLGYGYAVVVGQLSVI